MESPSSAHSSGKLIGAAVRGYEITSSWDKTAPLSVEQVALVDTLSKECKQRKVPNHLASSQLSAIPTPVDLTSEATRHAGSLTEDVTEIENVTLQTSQQFYKWYGKLEALRVSEAEEKYKECADHLRNQVQVCTDAKTLIHNTIKSLDEILELYRNAVGKSKSLRDTGERLVEEQEQLTEFGAAIRSRLSHFEELESIATEFHSIASSMDSKDSQIPSSLLFQNFLNLLKRIDDCVSYMASNLHFSEAASYESRFRQLHSRAMAGILHKLNEILKSAVQMLEPEIAEKDLTDAEETHLCYIKFLALVEEQLKPPLLELASRNAKPEYKNLLEDCQKSFYRTRIQLLLEPVKIRILKFEGDSLGQLLREGFAHLIQVCQSEHKLFFVFFPEKETPKGLVDLMDTLGTVLYDIVRPRLISVYSIDELCDYVSILKNEIYEGQIESMGDSVDALRTIVMRTLEDAQERLIYRAQTFIQEKITRYEPKEIDVNYPQLLMQSELSQVVESNKEESWNEERTCYWTLRLTLEYLNKLYGCLETKIFGGIAHEAVLACSLSIMKAIPLVTKVSTEMDGQLFAIRHLLLLREKLIPFRTDFSVLEKDLDFTHMRDHMRRIFSGEVSVFQLPADNVVQLMTWTAPRITDNLIDSKKQLEKQLKDCCEALIMMITKTTAEPILAFLTKVSALRGSQGLVEGSSGDQRKPLYEHAFASEERLAELVERVNNNLQSVLPELVPKIKIYLPQPAAFMTLFKPIKSNIIDAHLQFTAILHANYRDRDLSKVQIKTKEELNAILDAL